MVRGVEIEQVVDQRTFQPSPLALEDDEATAGNLGGRLEIDQAKIGAELPVGLRLEGVFELRAHDALFAVILGAGADGDRVVIDIGDAEQDVVQFGHADGQFLVDPRDLLAHGLHLGRDLADVAALGFDGADLLAGAVALALQQLALLHPLAALLIKEQDALDGCFISRIPAGQLFPVVIGILTNFAYVQHGVSR